MEPDYRSQCSMRKRGPATVKARKRPAIALEESMEIVHGVYDGQTIRPTEAVRARPNTKVLITFLDEEARPSPFKPTRLQDVAGSLSYAGPANWKTLRVSHSSHRSHPLVG
jgi:hypothetical protein